MPCCPLLCGWQSVFVFVCHSEKALDLHGLCVCACLPCKHMDIYCTSMCLYVLHPISLRWTMRKWWTSETRCYRFPCWWRSSLPHCCSRGQMRRRRWCFSACGGRWWAASGGIPAGRERATRKHKRCPDVLLTRQPQMWKQRLGRNGGRSHCLLERFQSHYGPPTGRPFLTSWLMFRIDLHERKRKMSEIYCERKKNRKTLQHS